MFQIAACLGIAQQIGVRPHIPGSWSYREWFSLPDAFYEPAPPDAMPADEWEGLGHIDPRARMYLQSLGLFVGIADDVARWFQPSDRAEKILRSDSYFEACVNQESIALHVRRGDTVTQPKGYQPLAPLSYYSDALTLADPEGQLGVVVFSDDIRWARRNLDLGIRHGTFVDHGPGRSHKTALYKRQPAMDWLDLQLMARCSHHVMSNSTYAWWSAWLSGDPAPLYPSVWWGPQLAHIDSSLMFPPGWRMVQC